jgi:asparaginyl-tRNA synthetase
MSSVSVSAVLSGRVPVDAVVTINGWVRTRRDSKAGFSFLALADGSCFDTIQIVAANALPNYSNEILHITTGCAVSCTGRLVRSQGKGQAIEMQAERVQVLGWVEDPDNYPVSAKHHTFEYLRDVAHLRPRTNTFGAVTRVRHTLAMATHRFFHEHGFYWIHTPIVTASDAEGAGAMFKVSTLDFANLPKTPAGQIDFTQDFFGKPTFLTVSGQWMIEPEIAFADLAANADLAEALLKSIFRAVLDERPDDMKFFAERIDKECIVRLEKFVESSFERISYTDAIEILEQSGKKFEFPVKWGLDLQSEHERFLTEHIGRPVVVMNYPKDIKAFYMRLNDDEKTVAAMDVLAPGIGEIVGGSQREERLDYLDRRMDVMHLDKHHYSWYRDLRRYGTVPHAGFGLGFERTIQYATGMTNIRDVIPFPRAPKNAEF